LLRARLDGLENIIMDNHSVAKIFTNPSSTLQHKHNAICYHCVHKAAAAKIVRITYTTSGEMLGDMLLIASFS
jgi:hypothetical protein